MADRITDRHKLTRVHESGAEKRKRNKEKELKHSKLLSKTRRMTDFIDFVQDCEASATLSDVLTIEHEPEASPRSDDDMPMALIADASVDDYNTDSDTGIQCSQSQSNLANVVDSLHKSESELDPVSDIGIWPTVIGKEMADFWIRNGIQKLQNCDEMLFEERSVKQKRTEKVVRSGETKVIKSYRKCSASLFERRSKNGELVKRTWLCFSPANGKLYCSACRLITSDNSPRTQLTHDGFCDWKHANFRLAEHEMSKDHIDAMIGLAHHCKELGIIERDITRQLTEVENYWRQVLKRVISVTIFICERGLAFRGYNETIGSPNNGNYLGILELIAEYDDFLKQHVHNHANRGSGHTNYLSSTISEEFVELMGKRVLSEITSRIKESRYYSISLDSTPDEGHVDQLTLVFRYMEKANPVERFVQFMPNQGHKAQDMFNGLVNFLDKHGIDIANCRGQSFDNASAMSGRYNGLQAKVAEKNGLASWIPCAGHSLNLVAKAAAECCPAAVDFFGVLEEIYVFFTGSTHRYELLTQLSESVCVPKRINTTRWSCRADATKALSQGYFQFIEALDRIADDRDELADVRCKARGLSERLCQLETGIYTVFWNDMLQRFNATSKILQSPELDLNSAVAAIKSLQSFVESKRDCFDEYEKEGIAKSGTKEYIGRRRRLRNVRLDPLDQPQNTTQQQTQSQSDMFRTQNFLTVIDQFRISLEQRLSAYELVSSRFSFLRKLDVLSVEDIQTAASKLVESYKDDIDECLGNELVQFAHFVGEFKDERREGVSRENFMYQLIVDKQVQGSFPNVEIMLRMYLVLMISNCTAERSFSKMKLIKNRLRTSTGNERLSHLALMSIESDILREVNFEDLITTFSNKKARKVSLSPF